MEVPGIEPVTPWLVLSIKHIHNVIGVHIEVKLKNPLAGKVMTTGYDCVRGSNSFITTDSLLIVVCWHNYCVYKRFRPTDVRKTRFLRATRFILSREGDGIKYIFHPSSSQTVCIITINGFTRLHSHDHRSEAKHNPRPTELLLFYSFNRRSRSLIS